MCDDEAPEPHGEGFQDGEILALDFSHGNMLQCLAPWSQARIGPGDPEHHFCTVGPEKALHQIMSLADCTFPLETHQ